MLEQHLLDYCREETTGSLSEQHKNKSATRGAQLVPIGIPTICLFNFEPNLIVQIYCPKDNEERHKLSGLTTI